MQFFIPVWHNNVMTTTNFGSWLMGELARKKMKQADLVRGVGLTSAGVSHMVTGRFTPSPETCKAIANFLQVSELEALRAAGHVSESSSSVLDERLIQLAGKLTDDEKEELIEIATIKIQRRRTNTVSR